MTYNLIRKEFRISQGFLDLFNVGGKVYQYNICVKRFNIPQIGMILNRNKT